MDFEFQTQSHPDGRIRVTATKKLMKDDPFTRVSVTFLMTVDPDQTNADERAAWTAEAKRLIALI